MMSTREGNDRSVGAHDRLKTAKMLTAEVKRELAAMRPWKRGVFYYDVVADYITVADSQFHLRPVTIRPSTIAGWARSGFFESESMGHDRDPRFIRFRDLITARMIAMMSSFGATTSAIKRLHDVVAEETGDRRPFARRELWTESPGIAGYFRDDRAGLAPFASSNGRMSPAEELDRRLRRASRMSFDEDAGWPVQWSPIDGVSIDPMVLAGKPCIPGRRIATRYIFESHVAGDRKDLLLEWYEIDQSQFEAAMDWESRLEAAAACRRV